MFLTIRDLNLIRDILSLCEQTRNEPDPYSKTAILHKRMSEEIAERLARAEVIKNKHPSNNNEQF